MNKIYKGVQYDDWELEGLKTPKSNLRGSISKDDNCRVVELVLGDRFIHKANARTRDRYINTLSKIAARETISSKKYSRYMICNGIDNIAALNVQSRDFLSELNRAYVSAKGLSTNASSVEATWRSEASVYALEQYYISNGLINQFIANADVSSQSDPIAYGYLSEECRDNYKCWIVNNKLRKQRVVYKDMITDKFIVDRIEQFSPSKSFLVELHTLMAMSEKKKLEDIGCNAENDTNNNENRVYLIYISCDLTTFYIMGYITYGDIMTLNKIEKDCTVSNKIVYNFYLDELTTMDGSVDYSKIRTRL
jgi:hypothetical protein